MENTVEELSELIAGHTVKILLPGEEARLQKWRDDAEENERLFTRLTSMKTLESYQDFNLS